MNEKENMIFLFLKFVPVPYVFQGSVTFFFFFSGGWMNEKEV